MAYAYVNIGVVLPERTVNPTISLKYTVQVSKVSAFMGLPILRSSATCFGSMALQDIQSTFETMPTKVLSIILRPIKPTKLNLL